MNSLARTRWAAMGAAIAVSLAGGGVWLAKAAGDTATSFVPVVPCRLLDTRGAPNTVGPRSTPLLASETYTATVWGENGNCTIPSTAVAVSLNVTTVNATAGGFLTLFPTDATRPTASNLNWVAGQVVAGNSAIVKLSADGKLNVFNKNGSVNVIVDVSGYFLSGTGVQPAGAPRTVLKDANGVELGTILPMSPGLNMFVWDGSRIHYYEDSKPAPSTFGDTVFFLGPDCTGDAYIYSDWARLPAWYRDALHRSIGPDGTREFTAPSLDSSLVYPKSQSTWTTLTTVAEPTYSCVAIPQPNPPFPKTMVDGVKIVLGDLVVPPPRPWTVSVVPN